MVRMIRFLWLMQLVTRAVRMVTPWIGRLVAFMISYMVVTVVTFWGGVPGNVRKIADEWLDRADLAGVPGDWHRRLYYIFYAVAFGMIVFGWIVMSYLTVFCIRLIFS